MPERLGVWRGAGDSWNVTSSLVESSDDSVQLRFEGNMMPVRSNFVVTYTISPDGRVKVESRLMPNKTDLPGIPRLGMRLTLPGEFQAVSWYGRGPHETYWDRQMGAKIGWYEGTVDEQFVDYSEPQENGNKTDVRWLTIVNGQGMGLRITGNPLFAFSIRNFMDQDLEAVKHGYQIPRRPFVTLNVDYRQMGVGGDNSWGARTHPEFRIPAQEYQWSFILEPFESSAE
jgi:beta-galactosidase